MSGPIIKRYTPEIATHSRVSSKLHEEHKDYFGDLFAVDDGLVSVDLKLKPWPRVSLPPGHIQECAMVLENGNFVPATPEEYERFNHKEAAARRFYVIKKGGLKKDGTPKLRKEKYDGEARCRSEHDSKSMFLRLGTPIF